MYINSLGREYENTKKVVKSIKFPTVRFYIPGKNDDLYTETITFKKPVTEADAITAAEKFLSEPVTEEYFLPRADALFHKNRKYTDYKTRGDMLSDLRFLEIVNIVDGEMEMDFGT